MQIINKSVKITPSNKHSDFEAINKEIFADTSMLLGTTTSTNQQFLLNSLLVNTIMPLVLAKEPDGKDVNWSNEILEYVAGHTLTVSKAGLDLNVGIVFDANNTRTKKEWDALVIEKKWNELPESEIEKKVAKYAMASKNIELQHRLGSPIDPEGYISYRICLYNPRVSNTLAEYNDGLATDFYISSPDEQRKVDTDIFVAKKEALLAYSTLISDATAEPTMNAILCNNEESYLTLIKAMDRNDKESALHILMSNAPAKFLKLLGDSDAQLEYAIRSMIQAKVLHRMPGTEIIIDNDETSIIIGSNMATAIAWFKDPAHEAAVNKYTHRIK